MTFRHLLKKSPPDVMPWFPDEAEHIWRAFMDIWNPAGNGFGPAAITHSEIKSYVDLMNVEFHPWEIRLIKGLSELFITLVNDKSKRAPEGVKNIVSMNDNAGLLALFTRQGKSKNGPGRTRADDQQQGSSEGNRNP